MSKPNDALVYTTQVVALELAKLIASEDQKGVPSRTGDARKYWLDLYSECLEVTLGGDPRSK